MNEAKASDQEQWFCSKCGQLQDRVMAALAELRAENAELRTELAKQAEVASRVVEAGGLPKPVYGVPASASIWKTYFDKKQIVDACNIIRGQEDLVGELRPRSSGEWKIGDRITGILHDYLVLNVWQERAPERPEPYWMGKVRCVEKLAAAAKASDPEDDDDDDDTDTPVYTTDPVEAAIDRHMPPEDGCPTCGSSILWMPGDGTQVCVNHHTTNAPPMKLDNDELTCTCPSLLAGHEPGCPLGGQHAS